MEKGGNVIINLPKRKKPAIRAGLVKCDGESLLPECWSIWIEAMVTRNADFAEVEPVFRFHPVKVVSKVVVNFRSQFVSKSAQFAETLRTENANAVQIVQTANGKVEQTVKAVQGTVNADSFPAGKMESSQFAPPCADSVRVRSVLTPPDAPVFFIGEHQAKMQEKNCGNPHEHWFLCKSVSLCAEGSLYAKPRRNGISF